MHEFLPNFQDMFTPRASRGDYIFFFFWGGGGGGGGGGEFDNNCYHDNTFKISES